MTSSALYEERQHWKNTVVYVAGGCANNDNQDVEKRKMSFAVLSEDSEEVLVEGSEAGGSNNLADFFAVLEALIWASRNGCRKVRILTHSQNNIAWFNGRIGRPRELERVLEVHNTIVELRTNIQVELVLIGKEQNEARAYLEAKRLLPLLTTEQVAQLSKEYAPHLFGPILRQSKA